MINLAAVDLNLLKAFEALMRERSVTRAAARIGLAQPSMSNALARLRALFDDPLFVRTPDGMQPTAKALALDGPVTGALDTLRRALDAQAPFDPARATGVVRLAATDNLQLQMVPALARRLARAAPNLDLRIRPLDKQTVFEALDRGGLDLALGTFTALPTRIASRTIGADRFVVLAPAADPALADGLDLATYARRPHILATFRDDARGAIDEALAETGLGRRVAITVGQFLPLPFLVAETGFLATVPASVAERLAPLAGCAVHPLPLPVPAWPLQMLWSVGTDTAPLQRWVRDQVAETMTGTPEAE